jgi:hypothetical protein
MIEAYQEQLIALEELRGGCPNCASASDPTIAAQLDALDAELHDAETYIKLPENLEGFLARLADTADTVGHPRAPTRQAPHRRSSAAPPRPARQPQQHLSPLGSFQIAARFGLASLLAQTPNSFKLRFIGSSMVSVSPDVDGEGRLGQMPAFDRRRRSPLRGRVATRARRVDATLSASAGVATARAPGRGRGVSIARPLAGPASAGKQPDPKSCSLRWPRIPSALAQPEIGHERARDTARSEDSPPYWAVHHVLAPPSTGFGEKESGRVCCGRPGSCRCHDRTMGELRATALRLPTPPNAGADLDAAAPRSPALLCRQ